MIRVMLACLCGLATFAIVDGSLYADDKADQEARRRMMAVFTFLNARCESPEGTSFKVGKDGIGRCFDKDGKILEERYIDKNNNSVMKIYKNGRVVSERVITEQQLLGMRKPAQKQNPEQPLDQLYQRLKVFGIEKPTQNQKPVQQR